MKNKTNKFLLVFVLMALGAICFDFSFNTKSVFAYSASITTDNSTVLNVSVNGTGTSIVEKSINVTSDCRNGYNLVVSTTESSDLYLNGNSSGTAAFTAVNGTSTLANSTNKWGYTLTSNPSSSTVFSPLSTTASTLKTPSETASPSSDINDTFPIYYGVKVDDTVSPGSYEMGNNGVIVYYLTMDTTCTQYTVSFNANGGTGSVANQNIQTGESTKLTTADTLTAPTGASYTDANNNTINGQADKLWTFWGWNTAIDGTGDWYKDKEAVEDLANAGSTITLYAQWKQATLADLTTGTQVGTEKVIDHNLMQDMSPEACYNSDITTAANAPAATLLDYRGKVTTGESPEQPEQYTVSKLADGLCWMTTNLNLGRASGGPNGDGTVALTPDDTDITSNFTLPVSTSTSSTTNTAARIRTTNNSGTNANGVYYSWAAAVARTVSIITNPTTTSICPKNWDLPSDTMFTNLKTKATYSSSNLTTAAPSSFLIDGGFTNGATFYQDTYSHYWTHVSYSATSAQGARVNGTNITTSRTTGTTYGGNKYYMKNIRCVASLGRATINYEGNGTNEYPVTGTTASQVNAEIVSAKIQANGFTRDNWTFNGWNTAADGSGTAIAANTNISNLGLKPGEVITLYAQWTPQYTITYVNNCMTYASGDANCTANANVATSEQKINLNSSGNGSGTLGAYNKFSLNSGWKIKEWTTNADGTGTAYPVSSTYNVTGAGAGDGITLYANWVPTYIVQYDGNGADNPNGMGTVDATTGIKTVAHTNVAEGNTFDLFASNFKKAGYGFVGWSTDANAWSKLTDNNPDNDAKIWGPNEVITAPAYNGTPITTLYAIWAPAETSGGNPVYLQNWNGCSAMTATTYNSTTGKLTVAKDSVTALTDERDNSVYAVAKLVDGNCWMIENLRLDNTSELSTSNTNISIANSTLPITNEYNSTTSNYLSATSDSWCTANSADCDNQSRFNNTNTVANITPSQTQNVTEINHHVHFNSTLYSFGNYYNWYSATAGYGTYSKSSGNTDGDLCPIGWNLPYGSTGTGVGGGNSKGGFYYLGNKMSAATSSNQVASNKFRSFPNNFIYSGHWNGNSAVSLGSMGDYWSALPSGTSNVYHLGFNDTGLSVGQRTDPKNLGYSIRCVFVSEYIIQYDGNGADNINGMGTTNANGNKSVKQTGISEGTKVTLLASNFKRNGYGFVGWSTDSNAWEHFTDNDSTNDPIIYGPIEDVVVDANVISRSNLRKGVITMYAVWAPAEKDGNNNPVYLQEWDDPADPTDGCATLTKVDFDDTIINEKDKIIVNKNSIIALTDKRDNMVYAIAKLADGNCWMMENLRLDNQFTMGQNQNDSSVTNESLAQGYGGTPGTYGSFVGLAEPESANFTDSTTSNSIYKSYLALPTDTYDLANNVLEDIGTSNYPGYRFPRYNNNNTSNLVDSITYSQDYTNNSPSDNGTNYRTSSNIYSYGNYYSWAAAMANTNYYNNSSTSEAAKTSICPSNWHLPTSGTTTKEYGNLSQNYGGDGSNNQSKVVGDRFRAFPNNFLYSGIYTAMHAASRGTSGYYWSRSSANWGQAYHMLLGESGLDSSRSSGYGKHTGYNVRCLIGS